MMLVNNNKHKKVRIYGTNLIIIYMKMVMIIMEYVLKHKENKQQINRKLSNFGVVSVSNLLSFYIQSLD